LADRERYLDPAVLEQLGNMQVKARTLVEGILSGMHRSPHRGGSVEFAEYIEYSPGHEIRHIDWRVFGKSDKYYVKQFQDETNLLTYLVVDGSGSMNFQGEEAPMTKMRYVSILAATLGYLFIRQGDAIGMFANDSGDMKFLPAASKNSHLDDVFYVLDQLPGAGELELERMLRSVAERAKRRSLIMIFSDMLDATEENLTLLSVLRQRGYDVVVFHVVDPAEMTLPYEGLTMFEGMENEGDLLADPDDLRDRYLEMFQQHLELVKKRCQGSQIEYVRFATTEPIESVALRFLRGRR
jgi:uncharacterized protein (DUF58 family)